MFNISVNDKKNIYRSKPVMNVDTTGSSGNVSIPKPLTYDYMPEGYPKKVEFAGTLMEEQSVPNGAPNPNLMVPFVPIEGNTYTVNFEGTDYNCICHRYEVIEEGVTEPEAILFYIGNPAIFGIPGETSEPFLYVYQIIPSADNYTLGMWVFHDNAESHTVSVQGTGIKAMIISPSLLPTGDDSPYELKEVGTRKVYVAEYDDTGPSSDKKERLYNEVNTAYRNGCYVLLYYTGYNHNGFEIYNLSDATSDGYYFSRIEWNGSNNDAEIGTLRLYRSSDGQYNVDKDSHPPYYSYSKASAPLSLYLRSSVAQKLFEIKVDDSGNLSATEVT